ncbi:MAG: hypothetical protein FJ123_11215 [Deltaproteobacteria bacterium]|nr:hypothetical protein [Deltaproteobacteria bacterium]
MEYLPVTVDKSHLITIGERLYSESIELIREVDDVLKRLAGRKEKRKAGKALKEALQRIHRALALNPDLSPL